MKKELSPEEKKLMRQMRVYSARYRLRGILLVEPAASRGRGKRKQRTAADQSIFDSAADHALGIPSGFPQLADKACSERNSDFFRITAQAIDAVNSSRKTETKITCHVRMALVVFITLEKHLKRFPTRYEIREWIEDDWPDCYKEESDWNHVWNESELDFLKTGKSGTVNVKRIRTLVASGKSS